MDNTVLKNLQDVTKLQTENEIIRFLEDLLSQHSEINLYGAIVLLKEKYGSSN